MPGTQFFGGSVPSYFGLVATPQHMKAIHDENEAYGKMGGYRNGCQSDF